MQQFHKPASVNLLTATQNQEHVCMRSYACVVSVVVAGLFLRVRLLLLRIFNFCLVFHFCLPSTSMWGFFNQRNLSPSITISRYRHRENTAHLFMKRPCLSNECTFTWVNKHPGHTLSTSRCRSRRSCAHKPKWPLLCAPCICSIHCRPLRPCSPCWNCETFQDRKP